MISVVTPKNEVLGFPDTMDIDSIQRAISDDQNGTISSYKPSWYERTVRPALEATGMDIFQPKFTIERIEPSAERAFVTNYAREASFGILENKQPQALEAATVASEEHPVAAFLGSLTGQIQAIWQTAGLGSFLGLGKVALGAGAKTTQAITKGAASSKKILQAGEFAGKAAKNITANAGVGALYGAITESVTQINESITEDNLPDLIKVGEAALKDAGFFGIYGAVGLLPSKPIATAAIAGTAYTLSKLEGASETDALLNAAVMAGFHLIQSHPENTKLHKRVVDDLTVVLGESIKAKNPVIAEPIAERAAQEKIISLAEEVIAEENISNQKHISEVKTKELKQGHSPKPTIPTTQKFDNPYSLELFDYLNGTIPAEYISVMSGKERLGLANGPWENVRDWKPTEKTKERLLREQQAEDIEGNFLRDQLLRMTEGTKTPEKEVNLNNSISEVLQSKELTTILVDKFSREVLGVEKQKIVKKDNFSEIEGTGETKTRGLASGVEEKAIENKLTSSFGNLPEYKQVNMKEQAKKASELLSKDPEKARRIAMGDELPPEGLLPESLFVAVENKAVKESDVTTLRDLAVSSGLTTEATTMGQRIRTLAERDPESPVTAINEVVKERAKRAEKTLKTKDIAKEKTKIKEEIKNEIKKLAPTKETWADFIKSIQC